MPNFVSKFVTNFVAKFEEFELPHEIPWELRTEIHPSFLWPPMKSMCAPLFQPQHHARPPRPPGINKNEPRFPFTGYSHFLSLLYGDTPQCSCQGVAGQSLLAVQVGRGLQGHKGLPHTPLQGHRAHFALCRTTVKVWKKLMNPKYAVLSAVMGGGPWGGVANSAMWIVARNVAHQSGLD